MKKFMIALTALILSTNAYGMWSNEERNAFFDLLYDPEKISEASDKLDMVNLIECVQSYYAMRNTYDEFLSYWTSADERQLGEWKHVTATCKKMIQRPRKDTIWI